MSNKFVYFGLFAAGVATGVAASWQYFKTKYEQIANEEIESVKEVFQKRLDSNKETLDVAQKALKVNANIEPKRKEEMAEYKTEINNLDYSSYSSYSSNVNNLKEAIQMDDKPQVIFPEQFGQEEDYNLVSWTYYADGHLVDEDGDLVDDIELTVGYEALQHLDEMLENDEFVSNESVYVRNDALETEYEIIKDGRNFADVMRENNEY